MCASYWNLNAKMTCLSCGKTTTWALQTHFMGDFGSYSHVYTLEETIPELESVSVRLDGRIDDFIGHCPKCKALFDVGAEIVEGKVTEIFILKQVEVRAALVR